MSRVPLRPAPGAQPLPRPPGTGIPPHPRHGTRDHTPACPSHRRCRLAPGSAPHRHGGAAGAPEPDRQMDLATSKRPRPSLAPWPSRTIRPPPQPRRDPPLSSQPRGFCRLHGFPRAPARRPVVTTPGCGGAGRTRAGVRLAPWRDHPGARQRHLAARPPSTAGQHPARGHARLRCASPNGPHRAARGTCRRPAYATTLRYTGTPRHGR